MANEKILVVDDDKNICELLRLYLVKEGYNVTMVHDGSAALTEFDKLHPDLVLLDVMMPVMDGWEVCRKIRAKDNTPIIMLTAKGETFDKVLGLELGADDYIVKPFSLMELEARVCAHLRREARHNFEAQVKFSGDLTIDYSERCLFFGDKRVGLAKKEFDIVELLSQNPGQVFDKERIYERIWGYDSEGDSSVVAEHIRRIRTKIAAYTDRVYIETVWGCGYKWLK